MCKLFVSCALYVCTAWSIVSFFLHNIYPVLFISFSILYILYCVLHCLVSNVVLFIFAFSVCRDKPKFGGPNTRKQACMWVFYSLYQYALLYVLSHRKCYNLMMRRRKPADSTPKQSKKQPRPQTDEAGPVQTRPHPSAMNKALLQRKGTRRIKGKSAVQLRWQVCSILSLTWLLTWAL